MNNSPQVKLAARGVRLSFANERMKRQLPVLGGIDLEVREGELVAIVGPSGCGKSSFLNAVDGLVKLTGGDIRVDGKTIVSPGPDRAMVFQQDSLFPWRTVLGNVTYGLELQKRLPKEEMRARAAALVD
ncbi:MAG TPA: ATP-binding cassette domain-containing protein, partial [Micropepsaceae bacterium]